MIAARRSGESRHRIQTLPEQAAFHLSPEIIYGGEHAVKTIAAVMAAMLLILSGCAAQPGKPADDRFEPAQAETAAPVDPFREDLTHPEAAGSSAEAEETGSHTEAAATKEESPAETENTELEDTMRLWIGETEVPVTWEENASVEALRTLCPVTIQMSMYGGFEQVGPIGQRIVRDDIQTDTSYGDIVLYAGNQIVIFYGSNSWAYTRLGHIDLSQKELRELLSNGDITITLK